MPDPTRKTISASQTAALYNASPYLTRWMLYQYLRGNNVEAAATDRMYWGAKMQPLVLERAAADLALEIKPNFENNYVHDDVLGYTADAGIWHPEKGPGIVESKCVFDYRVWMNDWDGGKRVPRHYELQLQTALAVGDGSQAFRWGMFAVWCCGEMFYFEREHNPVVALDMHDQSVLMLAQVARGEEPDPFGSAIEMPILEKLLPVVKGKQLDLREDAEARKYSELGKMLVQFRKDKSFYEKAADDARNKLRTLARDAETVHLPFGVTLKLSARSRREQLVKASSWTNVEVKIAATADDGKIKDLPPGFHPV